MLSHETQEPVLHGQPAGIGHSKDPADEVKHDAIPDVVCNLVQGGRNCVESTTHLYYSVMCGQGFKLVWCRHEWQPCVLGYSSCQSSVKALL